MSFALADPTDRIVAINKLLPEISTFLKDILLKEQISEPSTAKCEEFIEKLEGLLKPPLPPRKSHKNSLPEVVNGQNLSTSEEYLSKQRQLSRQSEKWLSTNDKTLPPHIGVQAVSPSDDVIATAHSDDEVVYERIGSTNNSTSEEISFDHFGSRSTGGVFEDEAPPVPDRTRKKKVETKKEKRASPLSRKKGVIRRVAGKGGSDPNLIQDTTILPHDLPNPQCSGPLKDLKENRKVWCYLKDFQLYIFHDFGKPATSIINMKDYKFQTETAWKNRFQLYRSSYPSLFFAAETETEYSMWSEALQNPKSGIGSADTIGSVSDNEDDSDYERPLDVIAKITSKKYASESDLQLQRHSISSGDPLPDGVTSDDDLYLRVKGSREPSPRSDYYESDEVDQWIRKRKKSASYDGTTNTYRDAPLPPLPNGELQKMPDRSEGRYHLNLPPIEKLDKDGYLIVEGLDSKPQEIDFRELPPRPRTTGSSSSLSGSFESISSAEDPTQSRESLLDGDFITPNRGSQRTEKAEKEFQFLHDLSSTYSGVLYFRRLLAVWQKRYCKVKEQTLLCYRNPSLDETPLLEVPLVGYKVDLADKETWKGNSFKLTKPGCDVLYFATATQESLRKWLSAIVKEIDRERFNLTPLPAFDVEDGPSRGSQQRKTTNVEGSDLTLSADEESDSTSIDERSRSSSANEDLTDSSKSKVSNSSDKRVMAYQGYMVELPADSDFDTDNVRVVWAIANKTVFQLFEDETGCVLILDTPTHEMRVSENIDLNEGVCGFTIEFGHNEIRNFRIEKQREFFLWSDVLTNVGCEVVKAELHNRKRRSLILWPSNDLSQDIQEEDEKPTSIPIDIKTELRERKRSEESRQSRSLDRTEAEKRAMQLALHRTYTGTPSKKVATLPASIGKKASSSSRVSSIFRSLTRKKYELETVSPKSLKNIQSLSDQMPKEVFQGPLIELIVHDNGNQSRYSRHGRVSGKIFYLYENDKAVKPLLKIPLKNASLEEFVDPTENVYRFTITSMEDNVPHVMCVRSEADVEAWMSAMVTLAFQNIHSADIMQSEAHHSSDDIKPKHLMKTPLTRNQSTPAIGSKSPKNDTLERKRKSSKEASSSSSSLDRRFYEGYLFELHSSGLSTTRIRRWCVATAVGLFVYRNNDEKTLLKVYDFQSYILSTTENLKQRWPIMLKFNTETIIFIAMDKNSHVKWLDSIRIACKKRTRSGTDLYRLREKADHVLQFLQPSNRSGSYALADKEPGTRDSISLNETDQAAIDKFSSEHAVGVNGSLIEISGGLAKTGKPTERYCYIREGAFVVCKSNRPDKELYRIDLATVGVLDESDPDKELYQFRLDYKQEKYVVFRAPDQATAEKWMVAVSMGMLLQRLQCSSKQEVYGEGQDDFNFVSLSDDWSHSDVSNTSSPIKKTAPLFIGENTTKPKTRSGDSTRPEGGARPGTSAPNTRDSRDETYTRKVSGTRSETATSSKVSARPEEHTPPETVITVSSSKTEQSPIRRASDVVTFPERPPGQFMQNLLRQQGEISPDARSKSPTSPLPMSITTNAEMQEEMNKLNRRKESLEGERLKLVRLLSDSRTSIEDARKQRNSSKSSQESVTITDEIYSSNHDLNILKKKLHNVEKEIQTLSAEINRKVAKTIRNTRKTSTPIGPPSKTASINLAPAPLLPLTSSPEANDVFEKTFTAYQRPPEK